MTQKGDPCPKCQTGNAMQRRPEGKYGDYWACWSCGYVIEDVKPVFVLEGGHVMVTEVARRSRLR